MALHEDGIGLEAGPWGRLRRVAWWDAKAEGVLGLGRSGEGVGDRARQRVRILKRKTLLSLQRTLQYSGAARLDRRLSSRSGFVALMYHSVPDLLRSRFVDPTYAIPAEMFDKQLTLLKSHCEVVRLSDAMAWMRGEAQLPKRAVVLTFDDGYLDNLQVAAPLLRWHRLPATLFVATGYVDRQEPQWIDELYCAFRYRQHSVLSLHQWPQAFDLTSERGERAAYAAVARALLDADARERRRLLDEVRQCLAPNRTVPRLTLSWDHLRILRQVYPEIDIGLHTHDHLDLSAMTADAAAAEVERSRARLSAELGLSARYLSYPYGRVPVELIPRLAAMGIEAAFATQPTDRITARTSPWAMPRYEVSRSLTDFRLWSEGVLPELGRRIFGRVADQV